MRNPRFIPILLGRSLLGTSLLTSPVLADAPPPIIEEIVVSASRTVQPLRTVGSAIDILTAEDIAARPRFSVADLLRELPGVSVNRSGGLGNLTQVRMRGAESNHTRVLIDGLEVGDPFNNGEFDFAGLLTAGVDRVEVLRGPQSALYGAQAIGGVINILTADRQGPAQIVGQAEGGSFGTYAVSGTVDGGTSDSRYGATAAYLSTRGVSQSRIQPERDGHHNLTLSAAGRTALTDLFSLSGAVRYVDSFTEFDRQEFNPVALNEGLIVDAPNTQKLRTFSGGGAGTLALLDGAWTHTLGAGYTRVRNRSFDAFGLSFGSTGRRIDIDYQTDVTMATDRFDHVLTGAVEYWDERFEAVSAFPGPQNQTRDVETWGFVGEYRVTADDVLTLSAAVRHDLNEFFADDTTYRVTVAWQAATPVKLRASYGTGVAKPGFYEMFGFDPTTFRGNPNLQPESSRSWDIGTDVALGARGLLSLTYFDADLRDEIITDFTVFPFTTRNLAAKSTRDGFEASVRYAPTDLVSIAASYTFTDSKDDRGRRELRRPRHVASLSGSAKLLGERLTVGGAVDYNGKTEDAEFSFRIPGDRITLDDYALVTVNAAYDVTDRVQVFGRLENAFDADYQEVFSYNHLGRGAYAGVKIRFGG